MNNNLYKLEKISKTFAGTSEPVHVLKDIDLTIEPGQSIAIRGASGSGKSTLLHILGTLDTPTSGRIFLGDAELTSISPEDKALLRRTRIGFIFQFHHLLPEFSTVENVSLPAILSGLDRKKAQEKALIALEQVGLADKAGQAVTTLSGGESQRVAIARAILSGPRVLLADEPTGNLDVDRGREIGELLLRLNREMAMTLVVVTHNLELASFMNLNYELKSGKLYVVNN
ncbi:ABC transporter ATP-binding protein [Desulfonatronovibrio hydrogenovorans]|uniref:ABC transporter ATP-binding protein n=1 Tax=Desulfonatronovibrio hydrogenovorans TaxID=53245 RepID=UPI0005560289|nr:ABC transporter ATP-binding protein [Desulfonatronovibrio hydrogenovorans]